MLDGRADDVRPGQVEEREIDGERVGERLHRVPRALLDKIISKHQFKDLEKNFPNLPHYVISDTEIKIPAGWLIEKAGFKGKTFDNYGVHKQQALVLVNYGGATGQQILELSKLIQKTIYRIFNISIEAEVNIF